MSEKDVHVWVIGNRCIGDDNLRSGVAEALGSDYRKFDLDKTVPAFSSSPIEALRSQGHDATALPAPRVILGGIEDLRLMQSLKRMKNGTGVPPRTVVLLSPAVDFDTGFSKELRNRYLALNDADLILGFHHQKILCPGLDERKVVRLHTAPGHVTPTVVRQEAERWRDRFPDKAGKPAFLLCVGGNIRRGETEVPFTPEMASKMAKEVSGVLRRHDGSLFVTTSPRTSPEATRALADHIDVPGYMLYDWHKGTSLADDPYYAMLGHVDRIIVPPDSISLASDALATGVPTHVYETGMAVNPVHRNFIGHIKKTGLVDPWESLSSGLGDKSSERRAPCLPAKVAASVIRRMIDQPFPVRSR